MKRLGSLVSKWRRSNMWIDMGDHVEDNLCTCAGKRKDAHDLHTISAILLIGRCSSGSNLPSLPREIKIWQHIGSC